MPASSIRRALPSCKRHLPFWLAVLAKQLLVLLVPALALLYPILTFAPGVYGWAVRRRVYRLYEELTLLEDEIGSSSSEKLGKEELAARMDRLEDNARRLRVPVYFEPFLYELRSHIILVRQRLERS